jgi:hypothetical protein
VDYVLAVSHQASRIVEWEQAIDKAIAAAPVQTRAVIEALQALRGVAKITAVTIVAEVGSFSRFDRPQPRMGYSGMVASELSSGNRFSEVALPRSAMHICAEWSEQLPGPISAGPGSAAFYSNDNNRVHLSRLPYGSQQVAGARCGSALTGPGGDARTPPENREWQAVYRQAEAVLAAVETHTERRILLRFMRSQPAFLVRGRPDGS